MMIWTLYICTSAWGMCGMIREVDYPSEKQCYVALNELYKRQPAKDFKYVICSPKQEMRTGKQQ